ncbi:MAG TPA: phosphoribosylanthranilate isomerase [Terriglobales bacterium]|nr:phosphoribosylanthranilate isomerase [Terriglobales bacterium]
MTWIKICGITNLEDAQAAVDAGADALGFVFYEKSPRRVNAETVRQIVEKLDGQVETVGVFFNQLQDFICDSIEKTGLSSVQLHGDNEDPHVPDLILKRRPQTRILVAVPMLRAAPEEWAMMYRADLGLTFLLDSGGGSGKSYDWKGTIQSTKVIKGLGPIVVAGGLNASNVAEAMRTLRPWGVDVSSGVESGPGKKDLTKIGAFVDAVREADRLQ